MMGGCVDNPFYFAANMHDGSTVGSYSDTYDTDLMVADQLNKIGAYKSLDPDDYIHCSWTATLDTFQSAAVC